MAVRGIDNIGIAVRDLDVMCAFFTTRLGLPVDRYGDADPPGATVQLGDRYLFLFQTDNMSEDASRSLALKGNAPGIDHISLTVDDVDASFRELADRGVSFDGAPQTDEQWGLRMVGFKDPEGNNYFLVQQM